MARRCVLVAALLSLATPAHAEDCTSQISAYRRAHGLSAVRPDPLLRMMARRQAEAMARAETVNHSVAGDFKSRVAPARRRFAVENVAAGMLNCAEVVREWDASRGHRENLLMPNARRIGIASVTKRSSPYRKFWAMIITN